jgi:hypothetical protein
VVFAASGLSISLSTWTANSTADSRMVDVTSNTEWTVASQSNWIGVGSSRGSNNGGFVISIQPNNGTSERVGTVTVMGGGITRTITVTQRSVTVAVPTITGVDTTSQQMQATGGNLTVVLSGNNFSSANILNMRVAAFLETGPGNPLYMRTPSALAAGATTQGVAAQNHLRAVVILPIPPNVSPSIRRYAIRVSIDSGATWVNASNILTLAAANALALSVDPVTWDARSAGRDTRVVNVISNTEWDVFSSVTWLRCTPRNGRGNGSFTMETILDNINIATNLHTVMVREARDGVVVPNGLSRNIEVRHLAPATAGFTLSSTSVNISDDNLQQTVTALGTFTGPITINRRDLPAAVQLTQSGNTITVRGTRPNAGSAAINGSFDVLIAREGPRQSQIRGLTIRVTLSPNTLVVGRA